MPDVDSPGERHVLSSDNHAFFASPFSLARESGQHRHRDGSDLPVLIGTMGLGTEVAYWYLRDADGGVLVIENGQLDTSGYTLSVAGGSSLTIIFSGATRSRSMQA